MRFASWCGVWSSVRSTRIRGMRVTGMRCRLVTSLRWSVRLRCALDRRVQAALATDDDVNAGGAGKPRDVPQGRRVQVAERGARTTREDGGEHLRLLGQAGVPDRIDAPVQVMQTPVLDTPLDRLAA